MDRILKRLGYVRLPSSEQITVIVAEVTDPDEAKRLTDELRREVGAIDADLAVLRMERVERKRR